MKILVQGCLHGELDELYHQVGQLEKAQDVKYDFLIVCGDFQSLRHQQDLEDMHCPQKYKCMGSFQKYFEKRKKAPILTIMIGGNHEAVNSFRQSFFGGWLAPNIYFLGQVGSIYVRKGKESVRITGASGIYKSNDFKYHTRLQRYPLRGKDKISSYHAKQIDLFQLQLLARVCKMQQLKPQIYGHSQTSFDIVLSHDWPKDIALYGSMTQLLRMKPFLKKEIDQGTFGNSSMLRFLEIAKPSYWFSAHMHMKYAALYPHQDKVFTHFLSLDKCLGKRAYLQALQIIQKQHKSNALIEELKIEQLKIEVDNTWIGILLLTEHLIQGNDQLYYLDKENVKIIDKERMNKLIMQFPQIITKTKDIGTYSFDAQMDQISQTEDFVKRIGLNRQYLEGICFEKKRYIEKIQKVEENVQKDQIDLQL